MDLYVIEKSNLCQQHYEHSPDVFPRVGNYLEIYGSSYIVTDVKIDYSTNRYNAYVIERDLPFDHY